MHAVIFVYDDFTPIEVFGAYNLLSRMPDVKVDLVAEKKGIVYSSDKKLSVNISNGIDDIHRADMLFIPGSLVGWTRQVINKKVLSWIRQINATTTYTASACTGSIILAATGLLRFKKATTFWRIGSVLEDYEVTYIEKPMVQDGKYFTAEGASSTLDMMMRIGERLSNKKNVRITQLLLAFESKNSDSLADLKQDEDLVAITNKMIFEEGKSTLSVLDRIRNAKLLLRLFNEE